MLLQLLNLNKDYPHKNGKVAAVNDVSLAVEKGDFITITGMSGSGKTTLLLIIGGLIRPTSGQLIFQDQNIDLSNDDDVSRFRSEHIGYVMQNFALIPYLTATENVMLALNQNGVSKKDDQRKAKEVLIKVGLDFRLDHYPKELSAGQQQRVAIARALATNPSIILADEPTGNLDPGLATEVLDILKSINTEQHTTIIMVTHNVDAAAYGNKKIKMNEGRLVV